MLFCRLLYVGLHGVGVSMYIEPGLDLILSYSFNTRPSMIQFGLLPAGLGLMGAIRPDRDRPRKFPSQR